MVSENPFKKGKIKKFYERTQIAKQVQAARNKDRNPGETGIDSYNLNRGSNFYKLALAGFEELFSYLKTLKTGLVLEIGAGTGRALKEIKEMPMAKGLSFRATALYNHPDIRHNLGQEDFTLTSMETLRGIEPESVAGVLSMYSITYAEHPKLAMAKINEVLIPGGIIKAVFPFHGNEVSTTSGLVFKRPEVFIKYLIELGYDVSYRDNKFTTPFLVEEQFYYGTSILLAIKPGNPQAPKADSLMDEDSRLLNQSSSLKIEGINFFDVDIMG